MIISASAATRIWIDAIAAITEARVNEVAERSKIVKPLSGDRSENQPNWYGNVYKFRHKYIAYQG